MNKSYKELTLEVCPTALAVKMDSGEWGIFEDKIRSSDRKKSVSVAKSAAQAWEEAYHLLDPNMIKIPLEWVLLKKQDNQWVIDSTSGWKWIDKSDVVSFQDTTYRINIERSELTTNGGKYFWCAYADDSRPIYYKWTTNKLYLTEIDCKIEIEEIVKQFGLKAYYEVVTITREWIK